MSYGGEHYSTERRMTDQYLRTLSVQYLYDFAQECGVEPADETVCDACAAYLIAQDLEKAAKEAEKLEELGPPVVQPTLVPMYPCVCGETKVLKPKQVLICCKGVDGVVRRLRLAARETEMIDTRYDNVDLVEWGEIMETAAELLAREKR